MVTNSVSEAVNARFAKRNKYTFHEICISFNAQGRHEGSRSTKGNTFYQLKGLTSGVYTKVKGNCSRSKVIGPFFLICCHGTQLSA